MPSIKMKTHKGTKSRFKVTGTGKVVHKRCGSSHLNSHKNGKKIRKLRKPAVLQNKTVARKLRRHLAERNARLRGTAIEIELDPEEAEALIRELSGQAKGTETAQETASE